MRFSRVLAVMFACATLHASAQLSTTTPESASSASPEPVRIAQRALHMLAIAEPDIQVPGAVGPSPEPQIVAVRYVVSRTGEVVQAEADNGAPELRQIAADGVRHWVYKPYYVNGEPRAVESYVSIKFVQGVGRRFEAEAAEVAALGPTTGVAAHPVIVRSLPVIQQPVRVSAGTVAGLLIGGTAPVYPPVARAAKVQGTVILHAIISKQGTIEKVVVVSGPPLLIQAAVDAVSSWRYRPYMMNGEPVEVDTTINVNFAFNTPPAKQGSQPQ